MAGEYDVKVNQEQIAQAESVIANAYAEMEQVARSLTQQAGLSTEAIQASAGAVTSESYTSLGGRGQALGETLDQLRIDLQQVRQLAGMADDETLGLATNATPDYAM